MGKYFDYPEVGLGWKPEEWAKPFILFNAARAEKRKQDAEQQKLDLAQRHQQMLESEMQQKHMESERARTSEATQQVHGLLEQRKNAAAKSLAQSQGIPFEQMQGPTRPAAPSQISLAPQPEEGPIPSEAQITGYGPREQGPGAAPDIFEAQQRQDAARMTQQRLDAAQNPDIEAMNQASVRQYGQQMRGYQHEQQNPRFMVAGQEVQPGASGDAMAQAWHQTAQEHGVTDPDIVNEGALLIGSGVPIATVAQLAIHKQAEKAKAALEGDREAAAAKLAGDKNALTERNITRQENRDEQRHAEAMAAQRALLARTSPMAAREAGLEDERRLKRTEAQFHKLTHNFGLDKGNEAIEDLNKINILLKGDAGSQQAGLIQLARMKQGDNRFSNQDYEFLVQRVGGLWTKLANMGNYVANGGKMSKDAIRLARETTDAIGHALQERYTTMGQRMVKQFKSERIYDPEHFRDLWAGSMPFELPGEPEAAPAGKPSPQGGAARKKGLSDDLDEVYEK